MTSVVETEPVDSLTAVALARALVRTTADPRAKAAAQTKLDAAIRRRQFFTNIQRLYGVSESWYREQYRLQGGKCWICRKASGKAKMLGVDHNHLTGEVRGLLCTGSQSANTCNRLIARYSVEALDRAAEYLRNPPARSNHADR